MGEQPRLLVVAEEEELLREIEELRSENDYLKVSVSGVAGVSEADPGSSGCPQGLRAQSPGGLINSLPLTLCTALHPISTRFW